MLHDLPLPKKALYLDRSDFPDEFDSSKTLDDFLKWVENENRWMSDIIIIVEANDFDQREKSIC